MDNLILGIIQLFALSRWNCKNCDMPVTTMDPSSTMMCPICGKSMVMLEDLVD